jgi:hypothetical protein
MSPGVIQMRTRTGRHGALCLVLLAVFLLAFGLPAQPMQALGATQKIAPALLKQMAVDPLKPLPVIVEMAPLGAPFPTRPNERLAQQALDLLRLYGQPVGALALVNAAAGFANAAGITALSLLPSVVYLHEGSRRYGPAVTRRVVPDAEDMERHCRATSADRLIHTSPGQRRAARLLRRRRPAGW